MISLFVFEAEVGRGEAEVVYRTRFLLARASFWGNREQKQVKPEMKKELFAFLPPGQDYVQQAPTTTVRDNREAGGTTICSSPLPTTRLFVPLLEDIRGNREACPFPHGTFPR